MERKIIEWNEPIQTTKSEEKLRENWVKCLEMDFFQKVEKYQDIASKNDWVLPNDPILIFNEYFEKIENEIKEKYKRRSKITIEKYNPETDSFEFKEYDKILEELFPIKYLLENGPIIYFPEPKIPETYLLDWMVNKKEELISKGLISRDSSPKTITINPIPKKTSRTKPIKPLKNNLKDLFKNKYGNYDKYDEVFQKLFEKELLSDCKTKWIGKGQNGIIQLASTIRWIGMSYLDIRFSAKEIEEIGIKYFGTKISSGSIKVSKAEDGQFYFF